MPAPHTIMLGMTGTGNWDDDHRPKDWRSKILQLYPNGKAPLTAIMAKTRKERAKDPEFYWFEEGLPAQGGAIMGVYKNTALTSAYQDGDNFSTGQIVYVKLSQALADEFLPGHQVLLRTAADFTNDIIGKVVDVQKNGAKSYLAVRLLEDDGNGGGDLSDADSILIVGNINSEGGETPPANFYEAGKFNNYVQIFRTSMLITNTAKHTSFRTGDKYKRKKAQKLEQHSIEIEKALIWGVKSERTGDNNQKERTTQGILRFIKQGAPANIGNFTTYNDSAINGKTWVEAGEWWLDNMFEQVFRFGGDSRLALVGNQALLGIKRLAAHGAQIQLQPRAAAYGIQIMEWITPFGIVYLKSHPLFNHIPSMRNTMLLLEPKNLVWKYIRDTQFLTDIGPKRVDGQEDEWLTEAGLELHFPETFMFLSGFNTPNTN